MRKIRAHGNMRRYNQSHSYRVKIGRPKQDRMTESFSASVLRAVEEQKRKGLPVAKYDAKERRAYLEYPDGNRTYVEAP